MPNKGWGAALALAALCAATPAFAQRADENAVRQAGDAFGVNVGNERVGLYSNTDVRGFSPTVAGNLRFEGLYYDQRTTPSPRLVSGFAVRVGITAQSYPFPAPTGVVDYTLRPAGDRNVHSALLLVGPNTAYSAEYDAVQVVAPHFSIAYGAYTKREEDQPKDTADVWGFSIAPSWRPFTGVEIRPFYAINRRNHDKAGPLVFAAGPTLPPDPDSINYTPDWTATDSTVENFGVLTHARLTDTWRLDAGIFEYKNWDEGAISDSYLNTDSQGIAATRRFSHQHEFEHVSISGEARLTGVAVRGAYRHTLYLDARGRAVDRNFGGAATLNIPNVPIGQFNAPPVAPDWVFGPTSDDSIRQYSYGLSYALARRNLGEISIGAQQVDYEKTVTAPSGLASVSASHPLFWNGSASLIINPRLSFYAAFTRGLEEAPVAPDVAANATEAPPAIRTRQSEAGFRYAINPRLRLVLGYFEIEKPYFSLDPSRIWRNLGAETHSGVEASLTGEIAPGLNLVAGWLTMEPRVEGEAVNANLIGDDPVGQPHNNARFNLDYRPPWAPAWSADAALQFYFGRPVSSREFPELGGQQLRMHYGAVLDLGTRYRFNIGGTHSTLRFQAFNVFDAKRPSPMTSGGMFFNPPLRYSVSLATDF